VLTEVIVFSMSRVLLAANKDQAVVIALGTAIAIMIGASFFAARPRISPRAVAGFLVLLFVGAVAAGAVAYQKGPLYLKEEAANRPKIELSAKDLAFDKKEVEISPAGAVIDFKNADTQPHNFAMYPSETELDKALFKGAIVPASGSAEYDVGPIEIGTYYFHCDVHPTMSGDVVVKEAAAAEKSA
jgi:plastocyanin